MLQCFQYPPKTDGNTESHCFYHCSTFYYISDEDIFEEQTWKKKLLDCTAKRNHGTSYQRVTETRKHQTFEIYNLHLCKVNTSYTCKVHKLIPFVEDITNTIQTETAKSDVCRKNGSNDSFPYISYLFNEVIFK